MCLDTGSPVLVDCKFGSETVDEGDSGGRLQRISSRINHIVVEGAAGSTTSTEEDKMKDLSPQRVSRRIKDVIVGGAAGSTTSTGEEQGRIFVCKGSSASTTSSTEDQQQDQGHRRRRNSGQIIHVETEDQKDLHRQRSGAEVFYIHRYQVIAISCYFDFSSLQSRVVPVWGWLSLDVF